MDLTVNLGKTKVMVFNTTQAWVTRAKHQFTFRGEVVEQDSVDKRQEVATGLIIGDGGLVDKASEDFLTLYPIPESWYVKESDDIQASYNFTDPSPGLLEVNATGRALTSAPEISVNEEDKSGEKTSISTELRNLIAEATSSEADNEHICENENKEQLLDDELALRNVATVLPKDIQKGSVGKATTSHGPSGAVAKPEEKLIFDLAVLDNKESTDDKQPLIHKDHMEMSAETGVTTTVSTPAKNELPGVEFSSDSKEFVETKPVKDEKRGRKGWSKLWDAIVQGRIT
ncbi:hypothetical protein L7F22_020749 [Adiantum nelumboides]|nr:hypothetical protein [Adiantum nelumboides]